MCTWVQTGPVLVHLTSDSQCIQLTPDFSCLHAVRQNISSLGVANRNQGRVYFSTWIKFPLISLTEQFLDCYKSETDPAEVCWQLVFFVYLLYWLIPDGQTSFCFFSFTYKFLTCLKAEIFEQSAFLRNKQNSHKDTCEDDLKHYALRFN